MADVQPVLVGALFDFPQPDDGSYVLDALQLGFDHDGGSLDRPMQLVSSQCAGLPVGSAAALTDAFEELVHTDVLAIIGPSVSDNALIARDLADAAGVPCINYSGGAYTRSEWMFQYQVGSLAEEPGLLAAELSARGVSSAAVVHDRSPVGRGYAASFEEARLEHGIETVGLASTAPMADDLGPVVDRLRGVDPDALVYLGLGVTAHPLALALAERGWDVPVVANSALMFGYARKDWRAAWRGWTYLDTVADDNAARAELAARAPRTAAGPIGVAAFDLGRLLAAGISRAQHLTRAGVRDGLERVNLRPAASGYPGTVMGFGPWDHGALKGPFLVTREWRDGRSVQVGSGPGRAD